MAYIPGWLTSTAMNLEEFFLPARSVTVSIVTDNLPDSNCSFSENILGLIPGSFAHLISLLLPSFLPDIPSKFSSTASLVHGIFVCGLVPGSGAYSSGKLFLGDFVTAVNGISCSLENFDDVLGYYASKRVSFVDLTIASLRIDKLSAAFAKPVVSDFVIQFGENSHWNGLCNSLSLFPFAVFCCPVTEKLSHGKVTYYHPLSDQRIQKLLEGVVPCLILLTDDYTRRSLLRSLKIKVEHELISVAVLHFESIGCFVLALPSRVCDTNSCCKALEIVSRVLLFYFGSLEKAFAHREGGSSNEIDRIITIVLFEILCSDSLFEDLQISTDISWSLFQTKYPEIPYLPLPETVKVSVDSLLTDFEAADFSDPFLIPPRRRFVIIGSCLFYKGYLVASHLNTTDLTDIALLLRHRFILPALSHSPQMASTLYGSLLGGPSAPELALSPRGEQSLIWCEVFPTYRNKVADSDNEPCWPTFGYSEPAGARYVLLVVPKKQTFLAVLLESASSATNSAEELNPDAVIIREASKLLTRLDGIGLLSFCEQGLASSLGVKLVSADSAYPSASIFLQSGRRRSGTGGAILQALAVTNAKKFSVALKGLLLTQRSHSMSYASDIPQFFDSETEGNENTDRREIENKTSMIEKISKWFTKRKARRGVSFSSSFSDLADGGRDADCDAFHYIESKGTAGDSKGNRLTQAVGTLASGHRDRAGVPGSYAGSGGTMSTSDGPGRDEGIPLPLANTLPTLFDMSEAHLHSGDTSVNTNHAGNRGTLGSQLTGTIQDNLFINPGHSFGFMYMDRNQGIYICPGDTYSPPGASMFHRRVSETFLASTAASINMFDDDKSLEEAFFLFPTDPVEWFDYDPGLLNYAIEKAGNDAKKLQCPSGSCSPEARRKSHHQDSVNYAIPAFEINPISTSSQSYWCTVRKFPGFSDQNDNGATSNDASTRFFALCGNEDSVTSALDLGLQFAFDLAL